MDDHLLRIEKTLTPDERALLRARYEPRAKSKTTAVVLGVFLGFFGAHRFYLGQVGWGIGYLVLLAWLLFVPFVNAVVWIGLLAESLIFVPDRVIDHNRDLAREISAELGALRVSGAPRSTNAGSLEELERLAALRDRGHLTTEEFERQKARLLE